MLSKKPSPAQNAAKPTKAKAKPTPKKTAPAKKVPRKKAAPAPKIPAASKWRIASPEPATPTKGAGGPAEITLPAQSRALMVIPQPEPLTPWGAFNAGMPASFDEFIGFIASGGHLAGFVTERGIPYTTMLTWINVDSHRSEMYARAREDRADVLADEIIAISDEVDVVTKTLANGETVLELNPTAVQRNKLRVDARKWAASKLKPRTYGEKLELGGTVSHKGLTDAQLLDRLASLGVKLPAITPRPEGASDDA